MFIHTLITQLMDIIINGNFSIFAPKWSALRASLSIHFFFCYFIIISPIQQPTRVLETQFPRNLSFS
jgi:hypothetical protein